MACRVPPYWTQVTVVWAVWLRERCGLLGLLCMVCARLMSTTRVRVLPQDIERDEVEFISKTLGCQPVAHVDSLTADKLGSAELVEESHAGGDSKVRTVHHVPI